MSRRSATHPTIRPSVIAALLTVVQSATPAAQADPHAEAKAIYAASCAGCHGRDLRGGGASSLADGLWRHGSGEQLPRSIATGIAEAGMPAFGNTLSATEIKQLVAYMRHVEKQADLPEPELPKLVHTRDYDLHVNPVAEGLHVPWAIAFLDDDATALISERGGTLRLLENGLLHPDPIRNTPKVVAKFKSGLLDIAVDPHYTENKWVYLCYTHQQSTPAPSHDAQKPGVMIRVVRGRIRDHAWTDTQVVWEALPEHYSQRIGLLGSRMAFGPDRHLYFSVGVADGGKHARDPAYPNGKIHRVHPDGSIPPNNPFASEHNAYPSVYTVGHRNPQGLATHPATGKVWENEHGPQGGDELNLLGPGADYGWPVISYGINYNGSLTTHLTAREGLQQPALYWKPSIAPCGMAFYHASQFPRWSNNLFVGGLSYETLRRLVVVDDRVIYEEEILKNLGRVRDVQVGPDGSLYVVLNKPGTVIRLSHAATHPGPGDGNRSIP